MTPSAKLPRILTVMPGTGEGSSFIFARQQVESLRAIGLDIEVVFFDSRLSLRGILRNCNNIRAAIRRFSPDLIHVHYGTVTAFATALSTASPLVITFHGSDLKPEVGVGRLRTYLGALLSQIAALFAGGLVCVTSELKSRLWWRRSICEVIPIGVNLDLFRPITKEVARQELGWDPRDSVVLFNAGESPIRKGLDLAEAAMRQVRSIAGSIRFEVMRGDVLPQRVPLLMNAADCLLVTSRSEGSPGVVKEALACNLPIVSVDVGDVAERLRGVSPSFIVGRDPKQIARALSEVLSSKNRSDGRERVAELSEIRVAERVRSVYNSILLLAERRVVESFACND
jgi:glycosyltransferase involved in cell wall biosynthesis